MRSTGIDNAVPYTAVMMTRENAEGFTTYSLPEGYHFVPFTAEDEEKWVQLQVVRL